MGSLRGYAASDRNPTGVHRRGRAAGARSPSRIPGLGHAHHAPDASRRHPDQPLVASHSCRRSAVALACSSAAGGHSSGTGGAVRHGPPCAFSSQNGHVLAAASRFTEGVRAPGVDMSFARHCQYLSTIPGRRKVREGVVTIPSEIPPADTVRYRTVCRNDGRVGVVGQPWTWFDLASIGSCASASGYQGS